LMNKWKVYWKSKGKRICENRIESFSLARIRLKKRFKFCE
jgi:hypothetical protein